jgi:hypothetical protein
MLRWGNGSSSGWSVRYTQAGDWGEHPLSRESSQPKQPTQFRTTRSRRLFELGKSLLTRRSAHVGAGEVVAGAFAACIGERSAGG